MGCVSLQLEWRCFSELVKNRGCRVEEVRDIAGLIQLLSTETDTKLNKRHGSVPAGVCHFRWNYWSSLEVIKSLTDHRWFTLKASPRHLQLRWRTETLDSGLAPLIITHRQRLVQRQTNSSVTPNLIVFIHLNNNTLKKSQALTARCFEICERLYQTKHLFGWDGCEVN